MNKCHFTIIMSCVQSTLRNIRYIFGQIRLSENFGLRITFAFGHTEIFRKPNLSEYLPNVPKCGLNTRHDNREVTLIHLTRAQTLRSDKCATGSSTQMGCNDYQRYSMLTVLPLRFMSCTLVQFIFALSCRTTIRCRSLQSTER